MGRGAAGGRCEEIEIAIRHAPIVKDMRKLVGLLALACFIAAPAFAETNYDGLWNVTILTSAGSCNPTAPASTPQIRITMLRIK